MTVDVGVALGLLAQLAVVIAALAAGVVWLRKWLRKQVAEPLHSVQLEVKPNHGASMRDSVDRTEVAVKELTRRFEDHLWVGHGEKAR